MVWRMSLQEKTKALWMRYFSSYQLLVRETEQPDELRITTAHTIYSNKVKYLNMKACGAMGLRVSGYNSKKNM